MLLRRYNGPRSFLRLPVEMEEMCGDLFGSICRGDPFGALGQRPFPAMNVWEDGDTIYAEADLPGVKMEDIEVLVQGDQLTIKGKRSVETPDDTTVHVRERSVGEFARTVTLPVEIDADKVAAKLRDGVLIVTLPKSQASVPHKIEVKG